MTTPGGPAAGDRPRAAEDGDKQPADRLRTPDAERQAARRLTADRR
ncbi:MULTISPECIES: hypothetical protein [Streptomyces]|nr:MULTISPECIES: hypothetical protein [Streptomyces]MDX3399959.1 hypothetical protein [Streptomyces sp. ME01-18h]